MLYEQKKTKYCENIAEAIELWDEGGPAGYRRVAPCLGASLTEIRLALLEAGRPVPAELEQAEEQAHAAGPRPCSGGG